jgi:hypothetical protein
VAGAGDYVLERGLALLDQLLEVDHGVRLGGHRRIERLPVEHQQLAVGERPDRGGARILRDQRHLAEEVAVAEVGDGYLVALGLLDEHLTAALRDDEE